MGDIISDDDSGKIAEDNVEQYLLEHHIPYRRNIKFADKQTNEVTVEFDFVIPNGIIEVKKRNQYHQSDSRLLVKQLERHSKFLRSVLPDGEIYLLIMGCEVAQFENLIKDKYIHNLKMVTALDQIPFKTLPYYIDDNSILFSLVSLENKQFDDKFVNAYIKENLYAYAQAIMTEDELAKMDKYKFIRGWIC